MPIDANINLRALANQPDLLQSYGQALQLKNFAARGKLEQMQMEEMQRQQQEQAAQRQAIGAGIVPQQTQQIQIPGVSLGQYGNTGSSTDSFTTPAHMDRNKTLAAYASNPAIAYKLPEVQGQFAAQDAAQADAQHKDAMGQLEMALKSGQLDAQKRQVLGDAMDTVGRAALVLKGLPPEQRSAAYPSVVNSLKNSPNPLVTQMIGQLPPQYTPEMDGQLDQWASHAAQIGDLTKRAYPEPRKQVPGVDVPLSPAVQAQKIQIAQQSRPPAAEVGNMSEDAKDMAAKVYLQTGSLPSLGMGKDAASLRRDILNRAAVLGKGQNVAANKADYGASSASLKQVVQMRNAVEAYENTADKNLSLFIEQAKNVPDTGLPIANAPYRALAEKMGSEKVAAYNAARQVAVTEIARVVNNPNLTGQLSDSARAELSGFNPASATLAQTLKIAQVLRQDMKNRHESLVQQEKQIRGQMTGAGASDNQSSGGMTITLPSGKTVRID